MRHLVIVEFEVHPSREHADGVEHGAVRALHPDVLLTARDLLVGDQRLPRGAEPGTLDILHEPFQELARDVTGKSYNIVMFVALTTQTVC